MNNQPLLIGLVLRIGVVMSFFLVLLGGIIYLYQQGGEPIALQTFQKQSIQSIPDIFSSAFHLAPNGIIMLGLFILVFIQPIRVAMTAWIFYKNREKILVCISLLILWILLFSLF